MWTGTGLAPGGDRAGAGGVWEAPGAESSSWSSLHPPGPRSPPFPNRVIEHTFLEASRGNRESVARPCPPCRQRSADSAPSLFPLYSSPGSPWRPPLSASIGSRRISREIERSPPGKMIPASLGTLTLGRGYPRQPASGPGSGSSSDRSEK